MYCKSSTFIVTFIIKYTLYVYKLFSILKWQIFCYEIFKILIEILYFLFFIHFEKYANEDKSISLPSCVWFGLVTDGCTAPLLQWWATVTVTAPSEVWVCCVVVEAFYFVCCVARASFSGLFKAPFVLSVAVVF
jgi:hypothetical protein